MARGYAAEVEAFFEAIDVLVDPIVVERIVELGASLREICEAVDVDGDAPQRDPEPSTERVAEVRALLAELLEDRHRGSWVG
jgi:hypothetical protein